MGFVLFMNISYKASCFIWQDFQEINLQESRHISCTVHFGDQTSHERDFKVWMSGVTEAELRAVDCQLHCRD